MGVSSCFRIAMLAASLLSLISAVIGCGGGGGGQPQPDIGITVSRTALPPEGGLVRITVTVSDPQAVQRVCGEAQVGSSADVTAFDFVPDPQDSHKYVYDYTAARNANTEQGAVHVIKAHYVDSSGARSPEVVATFVVEAAEGFEGASGANLPWMNYGWDVGRNPWGGAHGGFSSNRSRLQSDFSFLASNGVKLVRVFIFCDLRSGVYFNTMGWPDRFDSYVLTDFDALVETARSNNLRLIPVLLDYLVADGVSNEGGVLVGEHPNIILDNEATARWADLVTSLVRRYAGDRTVYAWEIMNEPEYASAVDAAGIDAFVLRVATAIKTADPTCRVTLGCRNRSDLARWSHAGLDVYQFHYYDNMEGVTPFDYPAADLGLAKPVLIGEAQPTNVPGKMDAASRNGYAGILFWSLNAGDGHDFRSVAGQYGAWVTAH